MDPQWIEALKEVLQGELKRELAPVHEKLDRMDARLENVESRLENVDNRLENVENRLENVENRLDSMQTQLDRIEHTQNEDVVAILHRIDNRTIERFERMDNQMRVLNDRLFTVEADTRKLQQS